MKKIKIIYWIFTGLFALFMLVTSIPYLFLSKDVVELLHGQLGYPNYIIPFLGTAKIIGAIVILIPGFTRIKEWAYAGLMFDLTGAMFSLLMIGGGIQAVISMGIPIIIGAISYIYHRKKNSNSRTLNPGLLW
jgi:DoxX-like protein